jgi:hypothetical protein
MSADPRLPVRAPQLMAVGTVIVKWYDRKGFYRIQPDLLGYLNTAGQDYKSEQATPTPVASETTQPARVPNAGWG